MKQKVVIRVSLNGSKKCQSKAMKIVVGLPGVESAALEGEEKDKIVVVGNGLDSINLTSSLRKKLGFAELESVTPIEEKDKKPDDSSTGTAVQAMVWRAHQAADIPYQYYYYNYHDFPRSYHDPNCTIL